MGKKKKVDPEDLVIPPQDSRICTALFLCQMTLVLSTVSIVYLTVAVYVPSTKAFSSGISETPVMCTTVQSLTKDACDWGSCGEWCLSKTSGACIQIYVNLRRNGSDLVFSNCTTYTAKTCYGIDQEAATKYRCINDQCKNLTGTFNCSAGNCINITDAFECVFTNNDPNPLKCSGKRGKIRCMEIKGLYSCTRGTCKRIKPPYNCDRRCLDIPTRNKNVILLSGDRVHLAQCNSGRDTNTSMQVWDEDVGNVLIASCYRVQNSSFGLEAFDCINGSTLNKTFLTDLTNFTYLNYLHTTHAELVHAIAPPDTELEISNRSKLMINMEGCVNTLMDECKEFLREFGKDGTDHGAPARFPCFFSELDPLTVVARFSLEKVERHFMIASVIPFTLMIISCITIAICQRIVHVGDDAKMRIKVCGESDAMLDDDGGGGGVGKKANGAEAAGDGGGGDSAMAL